MKARFLLLLISSLCVLPGVNVVYGQFTQPLGAKIGNQIVIPIPVAPAGYAEAQALIWYPDDYFLPQNANKRYPLYVFLHGAGEGSGNDITEVTNTSLPNLIANGLKPYGIDPVTKDTIKWIVISPHCASCGGSYSYPQLQYTIPSLFTAYRVDTSCVWVGGLSSGGRGTWSVVMGQNIGDTTLGKRICGIMPMANGGYDNNLATLQPNLDTIARRGLGTLYVIGDQDPGYNSIGFFAYQAVMKQYSQPGRYFDNVIIGGTHSTNVWNTPFPLTARDWSTTMNSWTQMWTMRKTVASNPSNPANIPPVANAGAAQTITLPTNSVSLTGTGTDADGTVASYGWTLVSGPNTPTITTPAAAATTVTGLVQGTYVFQLTVTDNQGATGTSTVQVTVNAAANIPPVANAGAAQTITLPTNSVSLTGTGTDADGTVASYGWTLVSGPNTPTITTPAAAATTVTGLVQGSYVFQLTVTDNLGATGTSTVQVTVDAATTTPPASGPVVSAGGTVSVSLPASSVNLSGSATDATGTITTYSWTLVSGPNTPTIATPGAATTAVTGLVQGVYVFQLTVTDDQGATGTSTVQVTVTAAANIPPVANAGAAQTISLPANSVTLTGTGTDADGTVTAYGWTQVSGPNTANIATPATAVTSVTGLVQGVYVFQLTVTDDQGATGTSTVQVTVTAAANIPPVANAGAAQIITLPANSVTLTGTGTDADGTVTAYGWSLVSGPNSPNIVSPAASSTSVTGLVQGDYVFQLTVTDDQGATGISTVEVTVNGAAANIPPVANAGVAQSITLPTNSVTLTGTGTDADGTVTTYAWTQIDGPSSSVISQPNAAATTVTGLIEGVYQFQLTVTDNQGATGNSTVQITVNAAPPPATSIPVVNAGTTVTITLPTSSANLSGSATDANGSITGYAWTQLSGPSNAMFTSPSSAATAVSGLVSGVYTFQLAVTDNNGATGTNTVQVVVNSGAAPSGTVVTKVACTEYQAAWLYSDGVVRSFVYNTTSGHVEFMPFLINGRKAVDVSTGFNRVTILDDQGYIWLNNGGKNTAVRWDTDATGAPFNGNVSIYGYFYTYLSIRNDGSIWYWGNDDYKFYNPNGGAINTPVKLNIPAGVKFTKLATGNALMGLTTTGDVYYWYKGDSTYHKVTLPRPASDIAASHMGFYIIIVPDNIATSTAGWPYAFGPEPSYWGGTVALDLSAPQACKSLWNMTYPIKEITSNQNATHYIDTNGDLYAMGDNAMGEIGNGEELVNHTEKYATPYAWDWGKKEMMTPAPVQIMAGTKFKKLFTGNSFVFYHYALDTNDSLYFWGRNKSFVGGDGVVNNQEGTWPNALDILKPTMRTPLVIQPTQTTAYNFAPYTLKCPAKQTAITSTAPLTAASTVSLLTAAGHPNYGYTIVKYQWTQVSGPNTATISSPNSLTTTATGLVNGTYIFTIQTTDNNTATISANDTIVVNNVGVGVPVATAGSDQTITLPTNSVTLVGTGQENGGTITGYKWVQLNGPATAAIASPTQAQTAVTGLIAGNYTFQLTITDQAGKTASATVKVTVNPGVVAGPPVVSIGADQTITLPTSSATISGTGTENNGTIVGYKWTQVSGPNTASIASSTSASTGVTGLVAGTYVFQLTITDQLGKTASATLKVIVNPAVAPGTPVANAGTDQTITLPTNSLILTGSGSETNGTIVGYKWTQVSGPNTASINSPTAAVSSVTGMVAGTYVFQLTVTDKVGKTASATVKVIVNPAAVVPGNPVANAGTDQTITLPTSSVTLTGSGSETNGTIVGYQWIQVSGPNTATFASSASAVSVVSGLAAGTYVFQLTVTDKSGKTASATVKVIVNAAAVPGLPVANAGVDKSITLPANSTALNGTGSETNGTIVGYKWTQVSGPNTASITSPANAATFIGNLIEGVYTFQLTVTDKAGKTASATCKVTVNPAPVIPGTPIADAGADQTITLPTSGAILNGSGSETNGTITGYKWAQLSGPNTATIASATSASTTISGLVAGTYVFQLTVTDKLGKTATATVKVVVNAAVVPSLPVADAGADIVITLPTTNAAVNGIGHETNGTIVSYKWKQLSGPNTAIITWPDNAATTITGLVQGIYVFQLTVTDKLGQTASDVTTVTVNPAVVVPGTPVVNAGGDQIITLPTSTATLTGSATVSNGTIVSYQWTQLSGPNTASFGSSATAQTTITGLVAGVYTFQLTVKNNAGNVGTDIVKVTVNPAAANKPPVANPGPDQTVTSTDPLVLDGSGSYDPDGSIVKYAWTQVSGAAGTTLTGSNTAKPTVYGLANGVYVFQLTVTDNQGGTGSASVIITVNVSSQPGNGGGDGLVADAGRDTTLIYPSQTATILDGSGSHDSNGRDLGYSWTQVSGPPGAIIGTISTVRTSVSDLVPGVYVFQLTVNNAKGDTASAKVKVIVQSNLRHDIYLKFYPNPVPSGQNIILEGTVDSASVIKFSIFDIGGRLVRQSVTNSQLSTFTYNIPTTGLMKGFYVLTVEVNGGGKIQYFKFIVD